MRILTKYMTHNWLVKLKNEEFRRKNIDKYNGVLYDLGCGDSSYKSFFQSCGVTYIGVDWPSSLHDSSPDLIADLNQPLTSLQAEIADTLTSFSVLEHLSEPQIMLTEAFRILKPGGNLVIQVPWQWWIHEAPNDYYRYTPHGIKYLLEKSGFSNISVEPQSGFFSMMILKSNYFSLRLIRGPKICRCTIKLLLIPIWYLGQKIAPMLDKFDSNWELETIGYFVTANKPVEM